jgi:hypothetical protein
MRGRDGRRSALLRVYPRAFRDRYADEIDQLLRQGGRPVSDRVDLLTAAVRVWRQHFGSSTGRSRGRENVMRVLLAAAGLLLLGAVTTGWAVVGLADGPAELVRHWWSSLALLPLAAAGLLAGLAWARRTTDG